MELVFGQLSLLSLSEPLQTTFVLSLQIGQSRHSPVSSVITPLAVYPQLKIATSKSIVNRSQQFPFDM